ncbi:MAG: 50S ribosomal protein L17 [Chlamydiota bacterium]
MRHAKRTCKLGRTSSHRRCLFANLLKSLILHDRVETSLAKGKELKRRADKMVTLSKKNTLASRRRAIAELMIRYNTLSPKEKRAVKQGDLSSYNDDRKVISKLFGELGSKYHERAGGYTRLIRTRLRTGDAGERVIVEYI